MSESSVTKKAISEGFKKTMSKKPFEKITISDITSECGLNRQTFYYHFQDKYELLNWIFYNDVVSPFKDDFTIENWSEQLLHILRILKENSKFYANTEGYSIKGENMKFISEFFAYGIAGSIVKWVQTGMKESPENIAVQMKQIVDGGKSFAIDRYFR